MAKRPTPPKVPVAGAEEDPNVEEIEVASPPCFAHELDEAWRPKADQPAAPAGKKKDG